MFVSSPVSSFLEMRKDPIMLNIPAAIQTVFDALNTFSETDKGKIGISFSSMTVPRLSGLTMKRKTRFQKIMPIEKAITATPLILLRSFLKCVQMQLRTGMAPRQKQVRGMTNQNTANVSILKRILITKGENRNVKAQILTADLYPTNLANGLDSSTARLVGMSAQSKMMELVDDVIWQPFCLRQEKKQTLQEPQITARPVENLIKITPMRVRLAQRSADATMFHIDNTKQSNQDEQRFYYLFS